MSKKHALKDLLQTITALRDPETGCPWDKKQTHQSLKPYLLEECYEALEAIDKGPEELKDELGDVLLQVVLHSQIASEVDHFDFNDVVDAITTKMIRRHPHVFGDKQADTVDDVMELWQAAKSKESPKGTLSGVSESLPGTVKAEQIGKKVARDGFDWDTGEHILEKVKEELNEFLTAASDQHREEEFGDLLFTLIQYARKIGISSEASLQMACSKFKKRYEALEKKAAYKQRELSSKEMEELWQTVKDL